MSVDNAKQITYPGFTFKQEYKIDQNGCVYSPWRGWHEMFQNTSKQGYKEIMLYTEDGSRRHFKVHRLVMNTYCPIDNSEKMQVNHKNGNKSDNRLENLEWCTRSENLKHAFKTGLEDKPIGEKNPSHKLTEKEVRQICQHLENKRTLQSIADQYGVTKGCIAHIKQRRSWKHISQDYSF